MSPIPEKPPQLVDLFLNLGAPAEAAETMASQLWRRAHQLADETQRPPEQCLQELLDKVIAAREGRNPG